MIDLNTQFTKNSVIGTEILLYNSLSREGILGSQDGMTIFGGFGCSARWSASSGALICTDTRNVASDQMKLLRSLWMRIKLLRRARLDLTKYKN
jgi:hypothetical protein